MSRTCRLFIRGVLERKQDLNNKKSPLTQTDVPFMGHEIISKGIMVDPSKVKAITDVSGVK